MARRVLALMALAAASNAFFVVPPTALVSRSGRTPLRARGGAAAAAGGAAAGATDAAAAAAADAAADPGAKLQVKPVLKFLAPTLALWVAPPVMSLIDTAVVGRYCGAVDLAALSPACTLVDASAYLFFFIATATTNLVAKARAEADADEVRRVLSTALLLAVTSGAMLTTLSLTKGSALLHLFAGRASAECVPAALKYASIRAWGQPAVLCASVARASCLANKDTGGPLRSVGLAFAINAVGTLYLVRGCGAGIAGAAYATLFADVTACLYLLGRMQRRMHGRLEVPSRARLGRFLVFALPVFATLLGKSIVYNGLSLAVGRCGAVALAAHQVLLRSFFFFTPIGDSIGMTSQVFLPDVLKAEARDFANGKTATRGARRMLGGIAMAAGACAALSAGGLPARFGFVFTSNAKVLAAMRGAAPILAAGVLFHAVALASEGMLLAEGDLRFLSTSYVVTSGATLTLLLSRFRPTSLNAAWGFLGLFHAARAAQFGARASFLASRRARQARVDRRAA